MYKQLIQIFILRTISIRADKKTGANDMVADQWPSSTDDWQVVASASGDEAIMFRRPDGTFVATPMAGSKDSGIHSMSSTVGGLTARPLAAVVANANHSATTRTPTNINAKRLVRI
jgi:hypothetical protein